MWSQELHSLLRMSHFHKPGIWVHLEAPAHFQLFSCQLQFPIPVTTALQRSPCATPISPSPCAPATRSGYQLWWLLTCVVLAKPSPKSQNTASASRIGNIGSALPQTNGIVLLEAFSTLD